MPQHYVAASALQATFFRFKLFGPGTPAGVPA